MKIKITGGEKKKRKRINRQPTAAAPLLYCMRRDERNRKHERLHLEEGFTFLWEGYLFFICIIYDKKKNKKIK